MTAPGKLVGVLSLKLESEDNNDIGLLPENDIEDLTSDFETEPALKSWLYDWNKKFFMQPDLCYDPLEDPLSLQGSVKLLKQSRHQDLLETKKKMHLTYQDYDKIPDDFDSKQSSLRFIQNNSLFF